MISKSLVFDHVSTHFPVVGIGEFGAALADHQWDRGIELTTLASMLTSLHEDADLMGQDLAELGKTRGQISLPKNMHKTINAVRRGVMYRSIPKGAAIDPQIQDIWDREGGSGIWDEDGKIEALGTSFLLTSFINGLDRGGYPKKLSKEIVRNQLEGVMRRECDGRTSYGAVGALRHIYRVMKYSELHTAATRVAQIRRGDYLFKVVGLALTDF